MGRLGSLYHEKALLSTSSATPPELFQKLHGTLVRPEILLSHKRIRPDDRHHGQPVEIEPLGNNLSADKNIYLLPGELPDNLIFPPRSRCSITVQPGDSRRREQCSRLLLYFLSSCADRLQCPATLPALGIKRSPPPAIMTHQHPLLTMVAERHIAMRTSRNITTADTLDSRRIGPARPQQQNLAAIRKHLIYPLYELVGKTAFHAPFPAFSNRVNDFHIRIFRPEIPFRQPHICHFPGFAVIERLQRRRRRAQDHVSAVQLGQHQCSVTSIITRSRRVLFIRGIVFLIHYHNSQIMVRQKYRRAGSEHHILPAFHRLGHIHARRGALLGVERQEHISENPFQTLFQLSAHCDFRHHIQHISALRKRIQGK